MGIYERLGIPTAINAAGHLTRLSGARMSERVLDAMREAARFHVRIEDLQERAGEIIAAHTGAEAGYVTSGASAGLTLATAACLAGMDVAKMDRLPHTEGMPNEVIMQRGHRNAYDHAIRAAGARIRDVGYLGYPGAGGTYEWQIEAAIGPQTVAIAHAIMDAPGTVPLPEVAAIAHRHGLPVIVDAAAALPPRENLRRFIAEGADLVSFSGGKAIRGPQASGILCGRADLIRSVALQHQDMDVRPDTWPLRGRLLESGALPGPPHQGVGRGFKVGKEEIVGLLVALEEFVERDDASEWRQWRAILEALREALGGVPGLRCRLVSIEDSPRAYPYLRVDLDRAAFGHGAVETVNLLQEGNPRICVSQWFVDEGALAFVPTELLPEHVPAIADRLRQLAACPGSGGRAAEPPASATREHGTTMRGLG